MSTAEADILDRVEEHTVDMDVAVVILVDKVIFLHRQHSMVQFLQPVVKLSHSLKVVSQAWEHQQYFILSNSSIIVTIVTSVVSTLRMGIRPRHAPGIGVRWEIRKGVLAIMYSSTLPPVICQICQNNIRLSCQRGQQGFDIVGWRYM